MNEFEDLNHYKQIKMWIKSYLQIFFILSFTAIIGTEIFLLISKCIGYNIKDKLIQNERNLEFIKE